MVVIWNPRARRAEKLRALRGRLESERGVEVREATSRRQTSALAMAAARRGARIVVAAGGDGTVSAVASGLAGAGASLGVLPLGTANDLARTLGFPHDPEAAWVGLHRTTVRRMDCLELRSEGKRRLVINMLVAGNGADVTAETTRKIKSRWGPLSYMRGAARVLRHVKRWPVRLVVDGEPPVVGAMLTFAVGNGPRAAGGLEFVPGANPADGRLNLVVMMDAPGAEIAAVAARLVLGGAPKGKHVLALDGTTLHVSSTRPFPLSADGEVLWHARRMRMRVLKGALRVALPR